MWLDLKNYKIAGAILEKARKDAGLTQTELARKLRKPQSFVSSYESGQRRIDILELAAVAEALNERPRDLCVSILEAVGERPSKLKGSKKDRA